MMKIFCQVSPVVIKPIIAKKINTVIKPNPGISKGKVPSKGDAFLSKNFIKPHAI